MPFPVSSRLERKKREKEEQVAYKLEQEIALWDPTAAESVTTDPFKTLFVGRINYYTSESKIRREFETYGPIKQIKMVHDKETGKPRGYCFIEYEHERDMHCKYLAGNSKRPLFSIFLSFLCGRKFAFMVPRQTLYKGQCSHLSLKPFGLNLSMFFSIAGHLIVHPGFGWHHNS